MRVPTVAFALIVFGTAGAFGADPAAGKQLFKSQCAICHSAEAGENRIGPSLFGVVSRKAGSAPGFHYSSATRQSELIWDEATLDKYLADPRALVPGTLMSYPGLKDNRQRADLIAYLMTLH